MAPCAGDRVLFSRGHGLALLMLLNCAGLAAALPSHLDIHPSGSFEATHRRQAADMRTREDDIARLSWEELEPPRRPMREETYMRPHVILESPSGQVPTVMRRERLPAEVEVPYYSEIDDGEAEGERELYIDDPMEEQRRFVPVVDRKPMRRAHHVTREPLQAEAREEATASKLQLAPAPASAPAPALGGPHGNVQLTLSWHEDLPRGMTPEQLLASVAGGMHRGQGESVLAKSSQIPESEPSPSNNGDGKVPSNSNDLPDSSLPSAAAAGTTPAPAKNQELPEPAPAPMPKANASDDAMKGLPLAIGTLLCMCSCIAGCGICLYKMMAGGGGRQAGGVAFAEPAGGPLLAPSQNDPSSKPARSYRQTRKTKVGGPEGGGESAPSQTASGTGEAPGGTGNAASSAAAEEEQHF